MNAFSRQYLAPVQPCVLSAPVKASSIATALVVTPDLPLRQSLCRELGRMRWAVLEAAGGAEALMHLDTQQPAAILIDSWLPDLEAGEFARQLRSLYPAVDLLHLDGTPVGGGPRSSRRPEMLHALREAQSGLGSPAAAAQPLPVAGPIVSRSKPHPGTPLLTASTPRAITSPDPVFALPEMVGDSPAMRELGVLVRLVAPTDASVLIEGETGTGKELVAKAIHRLSDRAGKPFVVVSRTGRIEAANGGTLFLDEIGEMPLALQAKMLRFLECGELQRIGDNDISRVNVRVIAATHQPLERRSEEGSFRVDLYHRLAVFPLDVAALRDRREDLPMLVEAILRRLGESMPRRSITTAAMDLLQRHDFPGNVRELGHVLHRAVILAGSGPEIGPEHIRLRRDRHRQTSGENCLAAA